MLNQALRINLEQHENDLCVFFYQFFFLLLHQIRYSLNVLVGANLALKNFFCDIPSIGVSCSFQIYQCPGIRSSQIYDVTECHHHHQIKQYLHNSP